METLVFLAIGIAMLYAAFTYRQRIEKLNKNGIEAEGVVFDVIPSNDPQSPMGYPLIRFVTAEKEWITEKSDISTPGLRKKGQKVTVIYSPDNPKEFIIKSKATGFIPIALTIVGIISTSVGIYKGLQLLHLIS